MKARGKAVGLRRLNGKTIKTLKNKKGKSIKKKIHLKKEGEKQIITNLKGKYKNGNLHKFYD